MPRSHRPRPHRGILFDKYATLDPRQRRLVLESAEVVAIEIDPKGLVELDLEYLGSDRGDALRALSGRRFDRRWKLQDALIEQSQAWRPREGTPINELYNKGRRAQLGYVYEALLVEPEERSTLD